MELSGRRENVKIDHRGKKKNGLTPPLGNIPPCSICLIYSTCSELCNEAWTYFKKALAEKLNLRTDPCDICLVESVCGEVCEERNEYLEEKITEFTIKKLSEYPKC